MDDVSIAPARNDSNMTDITLSRTRSPRPRPAGSRLGFGKYFTDHMFIAEHDSARGWHSPRIVAIGEIGLDVAAGAVQYGLSIFEALKAFRAADGTLRLFRTDAHARRLAASARRLCMPEVDIEWFTNALRALVRVDGDWCRNEAGAALYLRPTLLANEAFLGVRAAQHHTLAVVMSPVDGYWEHGDEALKLWAERVFVRASPGGVGAVKTGGNYASSLLAAQRAKERGFDQVLWLDAATHEQLEEAGTMNVFVRIGDRVFTPPLDGTILPGITRDCCLTLLREWGIAVEERSIGLGDLATAASRGELAEMWGSGTAAVIAPIAGLSWDSCSVSLPARTVALRLRHALEQIHRGEAPDRYGWLSPV